MQIVRTGTDNQPVQTAPPEETRRDEVGGRSAQASAREAEQQELEYLDIPAFLRNQAD